MATIHVDLPDDAVANITVGNKITDAGVVVYYCASRGLLYGAGKISILSKVATAEVLHVSLGDDLGIDNPSTPMTADISGVNIRLNITVDDASVDHVTFNYNKQIIKL